MRLLTTLLGLWLSLAAFSSHAADNPAPWMLANWTSEAPRLRDLGLSAPEVATAVDQHVLSFAHPLRSVSVPGPKGLRRYPAVRFVSSVARIDLPAPALKAILFDVHRTPDFSRLITGTKLIASDGRNAVARYRVEVPLPVLSVKAEFRIKHLIEDDSVSSLLLDGHAKSLLAMLGGMTEDLSEQPGLSRIEVLPVDEGRSLVVVTGWSDFQPTSWFTKLAFKEYPEIRVVLPYVGTAAVAEAIRHRLNPALPRQEEATPGLTQLARLRPLIERLSAHGAVALLHPRYNDLDPAYKNPALRYVSVASRVAVPAERARQLSTTYPRLPEVFREIRRLDSAPRPDGADLDLRLRVGVSVLTIPFDLRTRTTWASPNRLEFQSTAGDLERFQGAAEWWPRGNDSLMFVSAGFLLGDDAPFFARMAHRIVKDVPYADELAALAAQLVAMVRMAPWLERKAGSA